MARYALDPVLARIAQLAGQKPALASVMDLYRQWYLLLDELPPIAAPVEIAKEEAIEKLQAGTPLLHSYELNLHLDAGQQALAGLLALVAEANGTSSPAIARGLLRLRDDLPNWILYLDKGADIGHWRALGRQYGLDDGALPTIITMLMRAAYTIWAQPLAELIATGPWRKEYCPVCGGAPLLAELQGKEGSFHLRCGMCGADWPFPRLKCHRCGNRDPQTLGILQLYDDLEKPFVRTCSACGDYIKTLVCYAPTLPQLLPIEDIATVELDFAAERAHFSHAAGSSPNL